MTMRQRKRRLMARAAPSWSWGVYRFPACRAARKCMKGSNLGPITFPSPADTWGTVTHELGPFVPLPVRRDARFERRLARRMAAIPAALVITEA